jgi:hypothetical protein
VLAAASLVALTLTAVDRHPIWPHQSLSLAEAAGVRDEAEVTRLVEDGADPNARYPVRPGVVFDVAMRLTPLEAAVAARDPEMVDRLLTLGAVMDATLWGYLRCIADDRRVGPMLDSRRPEGSVANCDGIVAPWPER